MVNSPAGSADFDQSSDLLASDPLEELCSRLLRIATERDIDAGATAPELHTARLLDQLPDSIAVKDRRSRYVFANAAVIRNVGISRPALVGKTDFDLLDEDVASGFFAIEQEVMSTGQAVTGMEEAVRLRDGRILWMTTSRMPLHDQDGQIVGVIRISQDITERKRQEKLRHGHARLLEMIARGQPLGSVLHALVHLIEEELDGIMASVMFLDEDERHLSSAASPSLPPAFVKLTEGLEIGPFHGSCGTAAWRRSPVIACDILSDPLWEPFREFAIMFELGSCWSTPIMGPEGRVLGTIGLYSAGPRTPTKLETELMAMATDIAGIAIERARNEDRIQHMAHHDPLTGLPNRALFWAQFNHALVQARREARKVVVVYIDLDNFKPVNDTLGHAAGDEVLKVLASRIAGSIRASDIVVRLGGDEFAIVFSNPDHDEEAILRRLGDIRNVICRPITIEGESIVVTSSMGVAFFPRDGDNPEGLLAAADRAMYEAKQSGRDTLCLCA
ncbi:sensor domain-containing protein [Neorhizobium alkalisoli]|uniref:PAS domain S-box-containing protein/diguanylate cyclase (GGDEF)-like protein n=1 Tax=Neorhizobium alkalisoli TaxID=528178 RepID=A0A561R3B3_9HYPH|nr:diguanylate cyclase [Neorhizobium alkalisoli]TWF57081.1 PAS domain S-box-containing protein/diguanylate cyclase (GGDEF)-like protein [Neorhizobium alkalisoli]